MHSQCSPHGVTCIREAPSFCMQPGSAATHDKGVSSTVANVQLMLLQAPLERRASTDFEEVTVIAKASLQADQVDVKVEFVVSGWPQDDNTSTLKFISCGCLKPV